MTQTQAIANQQPRPLPQVPSQAEIRQWADVVEMTGYSLGEIALLRSKQGKDPAPPAEMAVFLLAAKALGLDPRINECYWIRRNGKGALQVGVDGFRKRAAMTREYAGSDEAIYRGVIELKEGNDEDARVITVPEQASVVVWRMVQGRKCAFTGTARWREYYPGPGEGGRMYRKMPYLMLGKDAETQGIRKGFSDAMSGMPSSAVAEGLLAEGGSQITEQARAPRAALTAADYDRIHAGEEASMGGVDEPEKQETFPGEDAGEAGWEGDRALDLVQADTAIGKAFTRALRTAQDKGIETAQFEVDFPFDRLQVLARTERLWDAISRLWDGRESTPTSAAPTASAPMPQHMAIPPTDAGPNYPPARVSVRHELAQQLAGLIHTAAAASVPYDDVQVSYPAEREVVENAITLLQGRLEAADKVVPDPES